MSRFNFQLILGLVLTVIISAILVVYGLNEEERMLNYSKEERANAVEVGAKLFQDQCSRCHGPQGLGIQYTCPPLNDRYFFDQRLKDVGWVGTMEDYIVATGSSGRLVSTRPQLYPGNSTPPAMPAFSDRFGGPLREDQLRSIAAFITNWEPSATLVEAPTAPVGPPVGTDITKELPEGNAAAGEALATAQGCVACHIATPTGPAWNPTEDQPGIGERAALRIAQDDYEGQAVDAEQYLFESIVNIIAYVVPGYPDNVMPAVYGTNLTDQNMADLIAYLLTIK